MFQHLHSCKPFKFLFNLNNLPDCINDSAIIANFKSHLQQTIFIPVNPRSTQIWRRLEIFRGTKQASEGRGIEAKFEASLVGGGGGGGGGGGKRGTVHCLIPLCPPPHSPCGFAVAQNFTKRDPTITPATQATTFMKTNASVAFYREIWWSNRETGRFDNKLGHSRQNRESWQVCILNNATVIASIITIITNYIFLESLQIIKKYNPMLNVGIKAAKELVLF